MERGHRVPCAEVGLRYDREYWSQPRVGPEYGHTHTFCSSAPVEEGGCRRRGGNEVGTFAGLGATGPHSSH